MNPFDFPFFGHALLMALLLSILFGVISFFVVFRRMVFLGAGISHAAFGGITLGFLLGIDPFVAALIFCIGVAVTIGRLVRIRKMTYDAAIGLFFGLTMGLGSIALALKRAYAFDLSGYFFGNILSVTRDDLLLTFFILLGMLGFLLSFFHRLLFYTFDEQVAEVSGIRVHILETGLLFCLAVIIVVGIKLVGIILIVSLLVLPTHLGLTFSSDYRKVLIIGVLLTAWVMLMGLGLSYAFDLPPGGSIVVFGGAIYFIITFIKASFRWCKKLSSLAAESLPKQP